jgi:hypothetical protein
MKRIAPRLLIWCNLARRFSSVSRIVRLLFSGIRMYVCYVPLEMTSLFLYFPLAMRLALFSSSKRPIKNVLPPRKLLLQSIRYATLLCRSTILILSNKLSVLVSYSPCQKKPRQVKPSSERRDGTALRYQIFGLDFLCLCSHLHVSLCILLPTVPRRLVKLPSL